MLINIKKILLFGGDLAALHLALLTTLVLRYGQAGLAEAWSRHWPHFFVVSLIWLIIFHINGLYDLNLRALSRGFWRRFANSLIIAGALSVAYFYLNVRTAIAPKTNLAIWGGFSALFLCSWRYLYQAAIRSFLTPRNLAIIGSEKQIATLRAEIGKNPGAGYRLNFYCQEAAGLTTLATDLKAAGAETIVIGDDLGNNRLLQDTLLTCLDNKTDFFKYPDFYELLTGGVPVEAITSDWFLENIQAGQKGYFNFLKRGLDLIGSLLVLVAALPFALLIAGTIKITSRGPVFFYQTRLGRDDRPFKMIKFRTMRIENNDFSPTAASDERITKFGSFLRRTRLDEIPQAINVLRGEMSFIGPRPERPEIAVELEKTIPFYRTRRLIKPGLTGWDQVSGVYHSASPEDSLLKLQHDLFYLEHRSLLLDLDIALKTLATIVSRKGQ